MCTQINLSMYILRKFNTYWRLLSVTANEELAVLIQTQLPILRTDTNLGQQQRNCYQGGSKLVHLITSYMTNDDVFTVRLSKCSKYGIARLLLATRCLMCNRRLRTVYDNFLIQYILFRTFFKALFYAKHCVDLDIILHVQSFLPDHFSKAVFLDGKLF